MAVYTNAGGGGGASSDELTAARGDVLKGKTAVTSDSNDEPVEGTLELTGDLSAVDAKKGTTFYNTDAKKKETGMLEEKTSVYEGAGTLDGTSKRLQLSIPTRAIYTAASKIYATYANIASLIGLTAAKLAQGQSVLGMTGTYKGRGNATAAQVLSGYTFSTASLDNASGTMPNQGAKTASLNAGGSYAIPAGYHNGSGKVTANSLASQTGEVTAADGDVLSGKTYWKDGVKRTGSMANRGALNVTLDPGSSKSMPSGYYSAGMIKANKPTGLSKKTTNTIARLEHPSNMGKQVIFSAGTDWDTLVIYGQAYAGNTNPSESQWKRFGASCSKAMIASKNFPAVNKAEASSIMNLFILTNGDITWEPSPIAAALRNVVIERYKAY